jgi:Tol biopolymer transport system component
MPNNPAWSPDGHYIAVRKHYTTERATGSGEIWLFHVHGAPGQGGQQIVARPNPAFQKELGEPAFAPDGSGLYYTRDVTPGDQFIYHQDSHKELFQIRWLDLWRGTESIVAGGPGGASRPTPSPDGKRLAYVKRVRAKSRLFVMDLDSGNETMVYEHLDQDMQETWAVHGVYPNMSWTPDSRSVVFWAGGKLWRLQVDEGELSEISFRVTDSRTVYPVTRPRLPAAPQRFDTRLVRFAQRSADGQSILFESLGRLYLKRGVQPPRPLVRDAVTGFDFSPVWSPDDATVYFLRWTDSNLTEIRSVSARGGRSRALDHERGRYTELAIDGAGHTLAVRKLGGTPLLGSEWGVRPGLYLLSLRSGQMDFVTDRGVRPHF